MPELHTCDATGDEIFAAVTEAIGHQSLADGISGVRQATRLSKGCAIVELAIQHTRLAAHQLNHLADSHAGREAMGVHDQVGADTQL